MQSFLLAHPNPLPLKHIFILPTWILREVILLLSGSDCVCAST